MKGDACMSKGDIALAVIAAALIACIAVAAVRAPETDAPADTPASIPVETWAADGVPAWATAPADTPASGTDHGGGPGNARR